MRIHSHRLWITAAALLTVVLLLVVFPILYARYGLVTAILLGVVLVYGMILYYLRGALMSRPRAGNSPIPGDEGRNGDSPGR